MDNNKSPKDLLKEQKEEANRRHQNQKSNQQQRFEVPEYKIGHKSDNKLDTTQTVKNIVADFSTKILASGATKDLSTKINDDEIIIKMKLQ